MLIAMGEDQMLTIRGTAGQGGRLGARVPAELRAGDGPLSVSVPYWSASASTSEAALAVGWLGAWASAACMAITAASRWPDHGWAVRPRSRDR